MWSKAEYNPEIEEMIRSGPHKKTHKIHGYTFSHLQGLHIMCFMRGLHDSHALGGKIRCIMLF